jgi:hypothetical protein
VKVFISWSGQRSCDVASALGEWLPQVINAVDPFVSARNLPAGSRWAIEIGQRLENTSFGIVCVTKENQSAPWLNYEAGAIAKSIDASRVVPLAIDLAPADIVEPLSEFQGTRADKQGIQEIVNSINEECPSPLSEKYLNKSFEKWWPDLATDLEEIEANTYEAEAEHSSPPRDERAILEEVLHTVRGLAAQRSRPVDFNPRIQSQLSEDIQNLLRSSGLRSWTTTYSPDMAAPSAVEIEPNEPLSSHTMEELAFLGKLRNVAISVRDPATATGDAAEN